MKLLVVVSMPGAVGIRRRRDAQPGADGWGEIGRAAVTADANTLVRAARLADADSIALRDLHAGGSNIYKRALPPSVEFIGGIRLGPVPFLGDIADADAAILHGFGSPAGGDGFFRRCFDSKVKAVRYGDQLLGEADVIAAVLGAWGIPVAWASGTEHAVRNLRDRYGIPVFSVEKERGHYLHGTREKVEDARTRTAVEESAARALRNGAPVLVNLPPDAVLTVALDSPLAGARIDPDDDGNFNYAFPMENAREEFGNLARLLFCGNVPGWFASVSVVWGNLLRSLSHDKRLGMLAGLRQ